MAFLMGLLAVLKVVGIVALIVLIVIAAIVALVLFVPVKYEAHGQFKDRKLKIRFNVRWMFKLVDFSGQFRDGKLKYRLKLAFKTLLSSSKKKRKKKKRRRGAGRSPDFGAQDKTQEPKAKFNAQDKPQETADEFNAQDRPQEPASDRKGEDITHEAEIKAGPADSNHESVSGPGADFTGQENGRGGRVKAILGKIKKVRSFLQDEDNRRLLSDIKKHLFKILAHIRPRVLRVDAIVGLEDPSLTAQAVGMSYLLYPFYGDHVCVKADFESRTTRLDARFSVSGRVMLIIVLIHGIPIRKDYKKISRKAKEG